MKNLLVSAFAAIALSSAAFAATNGDIVLGFRATGGTGAGRNLEVNVGNVGTLRDAVGTTTLLNITNDAVFGSDGVNDIFGANWNARADLLFGYVGTVINGQTGPDGEIGRTNWAAARAPTSTLIGGATATPYTQVNAIGQGTASAKIGTMYAGLPGLFANVPESPNTSSWSINMATVGPAYQLYSRVAFETPSTITGQYLASDLFEMVPGTGPGTYVGTFGLWQNGDVTFSTAIPEPSTYAFILGALVLGMVAYRRNRNQQVAA